MRWLLDLIYLGLLIGASPWLLIASWRTGKYRQGWAAKFGGCVPPRAGSEPCIWLHAVSLGEVNLLGTLIDEFSRQRPDVVYYLTTSTKTGYEAACRRYAQHQVSYCPLDFSWAVRRALRRIRPGLVVLAELELWPNLVQLARSHGANVAIVNGRLSPRSFRGYRRVRPLVARVLRQLNLIAVQTPVYADRFRQLGARDRQLVVTGSVKFDGAEMNRLNPRTRQFREMAQIQDTDIVWLAGSTFPPEEELVIAAYQQLQPEFPQLRLLLVPRHPERFDEVATMLDRAGVDWCRRSRLLGVDQVSPVVLVDSVGELGAWWGVANLAFVGGSMGPRGGQNMIEPAAYGAALCFGPQTTNFRDVVQALLQDDAAVVVHDQATLVDFVREQLRDADQRDCLGQRAQQLVARSLGATRRTVQQLLPFLPPALIDTAPGVRRTA